MEVLVLIILIILCLFSLFMIAVVLLQSGKSAGLSGDIGGAAEQFMGKSKAKSYEGTLKKLTKVAAIGIMILAVTLVILQVYVLPNLGKTDIQDNTTTVEETAAPEDLTIPDAQ